MQKQVRTFFSMIVLCLALSPSRPLAASPSRPVALSPLGGPDNFGYVWDDTYPYAWLDASTGVEIGLEGDDDWSEAIPIGFDFPFYENSGSQVYLSTNGFLTFDVGNTDYLLYVNRAIPDISLPNDYIAPFWDDLHVGGEQNDGKIYYQTGGEVGNRYFVVEWQNVTWSGNLIPLLTFETILYENGDICFQYADLDGVLETAVIGVEDGDGVDGLQYQPGESGIGSLVQANALCFIRPAAAPRVKALPSYQSSFAVNGQATVQVSIRNTGEQGTDTYDLTTFSSIPSWVVSLYAADGLTPLTDTDEDGMVDAGHLGQSDTLTVTVKIQSPAAAEVGDYTLTTLTARSSLDENRSDSVTLQSALPASFAQAFTDTDPREGLTRMYLQRILPSAKTTRPVDGYFTGSTIGVAASDQNEQGKYIYFWERNGLNGQVNISDVEYLLLDGFGGASGDTIKLTDNTTATLSTLDHYPSLAVAPDGWIGAIWVNDVSDYFGEARKQKSNIHFAILDPSGNLRYGPFDLTQNTDWRGGGDVDIPLYQTPRIAATQDNRFVLAWSDDYIRVDGTTSDIYFAIYDSDGNVVKAATLFTQSVAGSVRYVYPSLSDLDGARVLLAYSIYDPAQIVYAVLDSDGNAIFQPAVIPESNGQRADIVQSQSGIIILAWTNVVTGKIAYAALDGSNYSVLAGPLDLDSPYARQADYVSVTRDQQRHVILTWIDSEWSSFLYYALLESDGSLRTPPMIFQTGQASNPLILSSYAGQGNAPFVSGLLYLPVVRR